jgi:hypothetical protein
MYDTDNEAMRRFDTLAGEHWRIVQNHAGRGLPMTPRAKALRAHGVWLTNKLIPGANLKRVALFSNAVGRTHHALKG